MTLSWSENRWLCRSLNDGGLPEPETGGCPGPLLPEVAPAPYCRRLSEPCRLCFVHFSAGSAGTFSPSRMGYRENVPADPLQACMASGCYRKRVRFPYRLFCKQGRFLLCVCRSLSLLCAKGNRPCLRTCQKDFAVFPDHPDRIHPAYHETEKEK